MNLKTFAFWLLVFCLVWAGSQVLWAVLFPDALALDFMEGRR